MLKSPSYWPAGRQQTTVHGKDESCLFVLCSCVISTVGLIVLVGGSRREESRDYLQFSLQSHQTLVELVIKLVIKLNEVSGKLGRQAAWR